MVELIETDSADGQESTDPLRVLAAFGAGLALSAGPFLALWGTGVFECALPLLAVTGVAGPDEGVDTRRYLGLALAVVGIATMVVVGYADPLAGDTDFLFAVAAILVGSAVARTDD